MTRNNYSPLHWDPIQIDELGWAGCLGCSVIALVERSELYCMGEACTHFQNLTDRERVLFRKELKRYFNWSLPTIFFD